MIESATDESSGGINMKPLQIDRAGKDTDFPELTKRPTIIEGEAEKGIL